MKASSLPIRLVIYIMLPSGLKFIPLTPLVSVVITFDCLNSIKAKALE